jgi:hypothetical protein
VTINRVFRGFQALCRVEFLFGFSGGVFLKNSLQGLLPFFAFSST